MMSKEYRMKTDITKKTIENTMVVVIFKMLIYFKILVLYKHKVKYAIFMPR